jgi:uncharacterized protein YceH (UPF0502 family)
MKVVLTPMEARVIGCLIEKQITTPDQYPLSLNALVNACNQKSNRHPLMDVDEPAVQRTLDDLSKKHLILERSGFGSRVPKYQHRFCNTEFGTLRFTPQELAIVCELLLRGPQTPGELRPRAARMAAFSDADQVEATLETLRTREDGPFVVRLARQPGRRDSEYAHVFGGPAGEAAMAELPVTGAAASRDVASSAVGGALRAAGSGVAAGSPTMTGSAGAASSLNMPGSAGAASSPTVPGSAGAASSPTVPGSAGAASSPTVSGSAGAASSLNMPGSAGAASSPTVPGSAGAASSLNMPGSAGAASSPTVPGSAGAASSLNMPGSAGAASSPTVPGSAGAACSPTVPGSAGAASSPTRAGSAGAAGLASVAGGGIASRLPVIDASGSAGGSLTTSAAGSPEAAEVRIARLESEVRQLREELDSLKKQLGV